MPEPKQDELQSEKTEQIESKEDSQKPENPIQEEGLTQDEQTQTAETSALAISAHFTGLLNVP